jgi:galactonate dehydratase
MRITSITAFAVKAERPYFLGGKTAAGGNLPSSDYHYVPPYPELYGSRTESMITRIETDDGVVGWGESQAPIAPEVAQTVVAKVLAPLLIGRDPRDRGPICQDMYGSLRGRGQVGGFQLDAIAGVDTALWDLCGKAYGASISRLLGGSRRETLPCYVSGLTAASEDARKAEAKTWIDQGFKGVKSFLGHGLEVDVHELRGLCEAVGPQHVFVDTLWRYTHTEAMALGRALDGLGIQLFEAPLAPEDLDGHVSLAASMDVAVAGGEAIRTRFSFLPWLRKRALDVVQPDLMRNGITETVRIAQLAEDFHVPVALHNGAATVIGMAATWQVAATLPNFYLQEYQPQMVETFSPWLERPLEVTAGHAAVPTGPGLGIEINEERLHDDVVSVMSVGES